MKNKLTVENSAVSFSVLAANSGIFSPTCARGWGYILLTIACLTLAGKHKERKNMKKYNIKYDNEKNTVFFHYNPQCGFFDRLYINLMLYKYFPGRFSYFWGDASNRVYVEDFHIEELPLLVEALLEGEKIIRKRRRKK